MIRKSRKKQRSKGMVYAIFQCLIVMVGLLMPGCVGVEKRPFDSPVALPESFSASGKHDLPSEWWTAFNDPGLSEAVTAAFKGNFSFAVVWDRLAQAEAIARREGALRLPSVDMDGAASRSRQERSEIATYGSSFLAGLKANYEIDLWGRIRSAQQAALLDVQATAEEVQTAAISLAATVADTWYQLAEAQAQVRVLERQIQANKKVLELVTERFRQGQVHAADVLTQRRLVQSTEGLRVLSLKRVAVLKQQLAVLIGRRPTEPLRLPDPKLPRIGDLPATGLPALLMQRRPDVRSAYLAVLAQDQRLASAIAARYPRISLSADLKSSTSKARDLFDDWLVSLAANLVHPLFDGGERRAEVDRSRAVLSQSFHEYGQKILDALQEVEDALVNEAHQRDYLLSLKKQLETAEAVIERTRATYLSGQLDYIRVLEALTSRQSLQRDYLTAQRELVEFRIDLHRALAGDLPLVRPELATLNPDAHKETRKGDGHHVK
jgi:NodT family efflux transporter outer membrane factor (OMF) lipoprotein